jgi:hypothetical protein
MGRQAGGLTDFGEKCRTFRAARDMLMADQARAMGVSTAFLSAVETGAKGIPEGHVDRVARCLTLSDAETKQLRQAADASAKVVKIRPSNSEAAKFVVELREKIDRLTPGQIRKLSIIMKGGR